MGIPKIRLIFFKFKRNFIPLLFCTFTILLVIFSRDNMKAAQTGLALFANSVLPSLLPFFIATELLGHTNIIHYLGKWLNGVMKPIFNVPGEGVFAFLMGIISGYPTGAKIVSNLKEKKVISSIEAERLIAFTNNSGPLFIVGTVGSGLFGNSSIGFLLLFTHILACITVGFLFRFWKCKNFFKYRTYEDNSTINTIVNIDNLGEVLGNSIKNAINTIVMIGGFVVLFSVINSMLDNIHFFDILSNVFSPVLCSFGLSSEFCDGIFSGIIELTNGVSKICSIPNKKISINIILCAFLLGLGGLSILLQVLSITSKNNISIKPYIIGKVLHACFSAFYTFLILQHSMFFNFNI